MSEDAQSLWEAWFYPLHSVRVGLFAGVGGSTKHRKSGPLKKIKQKFIFFHEKKEIPKLAQSYTIPEILRDRGLRDSSFTGNLLVVTNGSFTMQVVKSTTTLTLRL